MKCDKRIIKNIEKVLDYMWADEEKNWEECDKPKKGHIFCVLLELNKQLGTSYMDPSEDYVAQITQSKGGD